MVIYAGAGVSERTCFGICKGKKGELTVEHYYIDSRIFSNSTEKLGLLIIAMRNSEVKGSDIPG